MMRAGWLLAAALLTGCAGTNVRPIVASAEDLDPDASADGIRYYEPAPYLLVYSDGKGGLKSQLVVLPDLTRMRSIDPFAYFASNNSTLTFSNGMLTESKSIIDETMVPGKMIGALEKIATGMLAGTLNEGRAGPPTQLPPPRLFRIHFTKDGARLLGEEPKDANGNVRMIDVTIPNSGGADEEEKDKKDGAKGEKEQ